MCQLAMQNFWESCIKSSLLSGESQLLSDRMSLCHPDVRRCSQGTAHEAPALPFPNHKEIIHPPPYHSCPESREKKTKRWALAGTCSMPQGQRRQASWNCPSVSWSTANTMLATRVCSPAGMMCARCQATCWHAENRSSKRKRTPVPGRLTKGPLLHPYSSATEVIVEIRSYSSQFSQTPVDSSLLPCLHLFSNHSFLTGPSSFVPVLLLPSSHCHNHQ